MGLVEAATLSVRSSATPTIIKFLLRWALYFSVPFIIAAVIIVIVLAHRKRKARLQNQMLENMLLLQNEQQTNQDRTH